MITGASSGIGAATAVAFAAEGARLLLAARRAGKLAEVASLALELGAEAVHSIDLDVRDHRKVQNAIDTLPAEWAEIDVLVNNAGLSRGLEKLYVGKIEDWEEMIDTNVKGLLYVSRAVVPGMVVRRSGHVVNLGSTAGEMTYPGGAVYCASKAAERAINDGLRQDLLGTPVRVTTDRPGDGGDGFQPGAVSRRCGAGGQGIQGGHAAEGGRRGRRDFVGRDPPAHVNVARVLLTPVDQANSLLFNREP